MTTPPPLPGGPRHPGEVGSRPAAPSYSLNVPPPLQPIPDRAIVHPTEQTRTYPCANCGDSLVFDPASGQLRSPGCGSLYPVVLDREKYIAKHPLGPTMNSLYRQLNATGRPQLVDREVVCQSCGGRTLFSGTLTAVRCPYCNTPIQRDDIQVAPARLPIDGILPLQVGDDQARANIEAWVNSRWFAPREFKKYRVLGSFTSVYLSYYSYDAEVDTDYSGSRGERRTRRDRDGNVETYTDWYPASGRVHDSIRQLTETANTGLDDQRVRELEPWPAERAVPYTPEFVAGHLARTYDGDAAQVFEAQARPRINDVIENTVRRDIGGDEQRIHRMNLEYRSIDFIYLLMPVWLLTVTFANKPFQVFVNGVTGEVQGERPWSAIKIIFAVLAALLVIAGGVYLYMQSQGGY
jgi:DNA-directed RNA polymerase subunit RPC12/RpoP